MTTEEKLTLLQVIDFHNGKWPKELISGVMFFKGMRITKRMFLNAVKYGVSDG